MKALQLTGIGKLEMVDAPLPAIGDDEMLIRTGAAVICTSDLKDIRENPFGIKLPVIMGHEGAGTVARVGKCVADFRQGDRVATHPVHPCRRCRSCQAGMDHLCSSMRHFGLNMQGTFAEYYAVRADRARIVPAGMSFATAALAEPVCVCLEALAQAHLPEGGKCLIIGDGPFGVLIARLAGTLPLGRTVIAGHHDFRLGFAKGAATINTNRVGDPMAVLRTLADGFGYDAVILAVGTQQAAQEGLQLLRPKGRLVVFSAIARPTPIDLLSLHVRELEIVGACNDADRLEDALKHLDNRSLGLGDLVTHTLPVGDYLKAFELAATGRGVAMKVALSFQEDART